ncbi:MAG: DUF58 domain-containing protein [Alphaproteobacteria bacterium]
MAARIGTAERWRAADRRHRAEALSATLPPLLVAAERVAATVAQGVHGRRRVGQGETFWQFRRFEPGDSPRSVDWRRSATGDHLYVRETEWEAAQSVWLWRDTSPSMHYRSGPGLATKYERADLLTLALMSLLVRGGERVALLGQPERPASGTAALNRIAEAMERASEAPTTPAEAVPPYVPLPRYGTVVLFGDFMTSPNEVDRSVRTFAARGVRGHLLQVLDPAEAHMPFGGRSRFHGLESEGELLVGRAESLRDDYLDRLTAHQQRLRSLTRRTGWTFAVHHTDRPPQLALLALYMALGDAGGP